MKGFKDGVKSGGDAAADAPALAPSSAPTLATAPLAPVQNGAAKPRAVPAPAKVNDEGATDANSADLLEEDYGVQAGVWSVTSFTALRRNGIEVGIETGRSRHPSGCAVSGGI
mgnify:CR=1 FL=1